MNGNGISKQSLTIDLRIYSVGEIRVGPDSRGPSRCLKCQQVFKQGEVWQRMKSPPDPEYESYFVGVHSKCPTRRA